MVACIKNKAIKRRNTFVDRELKLEDSQDNNCSAYYNFNYKGMAVQIEFSVSKDTTLYWGQMPLKLCVDYW